MSTITEQDYDSLDIENKQNEEANQEKKALMSADLAYGLFYVYFFVALLIIACFGLVAEF